MRNLLRKLCIGVGILSGLVCTPFCWKNTMIAIEKNCEKTALRINSQEELDEQIEEYREKLDIEDYIFITGIIYEKNIEKRVEYYNKGRHSRSYYLTQGKIYNEIYQNSNKIESKLIELNKNHDEAIPVGNNNYLIKLYNEHNNGTDECSLRHEIYHIKKRHSENLSRIKNPVYKKLISEYWYEPQAVLYEAYNIKL